MTRAREDAGNAARADGGTQRWYRPEQLEDFTAAALAALGAATESAAEVAASLVLSNVVGHDSHGMVRLVQYADWIAGGQIRPAQRPVVSRRQGAVADGLIVDALGRPSRSPADFYAGGALLTFGGHKGSALSVLIELLGGLLTGMGTACSSSYAGGNGMVLIARPRRWCPELVAGYHRILHGRVVAVEHVDICTADAAGPDLHDDLVVTRGRVGHAVHRQLARAGHDRPPS